MAILLATLESILILEEAESLAEMINHSEIAEKYRYYYEIMQTDVQTQNKITAFVKMKDLYDDVQRFGRYHPQYKEIMTETPLKKREMDMDENIANFRVAENELQTLLDEVSVLIGRSVSEHIKIPTGNPFFEGASCSGGCGSGSGCGCSS